MAILNIEQRIAFLVYWPMVMSFLSLVGSTLTLLTIWRTRVGYKHQRQQQQQQQQHLSTFHRLLTGISVMDLFLSLGLMIGPIPIPSGLGYPYGGYGTWGTCIFQGFILTVGNGSFGYSAMLMVYYVLVIRYSLSNQIIASRVEPFMHFIIISVHVSIAFVGLAWKVYNPNGVMHCWTGYYPSDCVDGDELTDDAISIPCERGSPDRFNFFADFLLGVPTMIWTATLLFCLAVVSLTLSFRNCQSQRFVFQSSSSDAIANGSNVRRRSIRHGSATTSTVLQRQTRQVHVQCFLYAFSFLNNMVWTLIQIWLEWAGVYDLDFLGKHYFMPVMVTTFFPIQGLFNFCIFIRPRYRAFREERPLNSRWCAIRQCVWNPIQPIGSQTSSGSSNNNNLNQRRQNTQEFSITGSRQVCKNNVEKDRCDVDQGNVSSQENEEVVQDGDSNAAFHPSQHFESMQHPPATKSDDDSDGSTNTNT